MSMWPPTGRWGCAGPISTLVMLALVTVTAIVADIPFASEALIVVVPTLAAMT